MGEVVNIPVDIPITAYSDDTYGLRTAADAVYTHDCPVVLRPVVLWAVDLSPLRSKESWHGAIPFASAAGGTDSQPDLSLPVMAYGQTGRNEESE